MENALFLAGQAACTIEQSRLQLRSRTSFLFLRRVDEVNDSSIGAAAASVRAFSDDDNFVCARKNFLPSCSTPPCAGIMDARRRPPDGTRTSCSRTAPNRKHQNLDPRRRPPAARRGKAIIFFTKPRRRPPAAPCISCSPAIGL